MNRIIEPVMSWDRDREGRWWDHEVKDRKNWWENERWREFKGWDRW
jgi:hypothetical protein